MSDVWHTPRYPDLADDTAYEEVLGTLTDLTDALLDSVKAMDDDQVRGPSACDGWTRGHVLTHLARNADGLRNLLEWARTGVQTPAYASRQARDADIESGAGRTASELEADLDAASERLLAEIAVLPPDRRHVPVGMSSGSLEPAHEVLWLRVREVAYHHVDLLTGYSFAHVHDWVVARGLDEAAERLRDGDTLPITLVATDTGQEVSVGNEGAVVRGRAGDLLAWVTGRGDGADLASDSRLPSLPPWG